MNRPSKIGAEVGGQVAPHISIVIPVFNDAAGVARLLDSLRRQTQQNFEALVVDNGSNPPIALDGGRPSHVRILNCSIPGSYAARNHGARAAAGQVLAFTDADCVAAPDWLEKGLERLETERGTAMVGGDVLYDDPAPRNGVSLYQAAAGFQQRPNIERHGFSATANLFCTADQFRRIGPFDERLLSGGDREWAWRAATRGIRIVFEPRSIVRTRPRSTWSGAIRQARRVAAGRLHLRQHGLAHAGERALRPHRSLIESLAWLTEQEHLTAREKLSVLVAAIVLKGVALVETVRVRAGFQAERR